MHCPSQDVNYGKVKMIINYLSEDLNSGSNQYPRHFLKTVPRLRSACFRFVCAGLLVGQLLISPSLAKDTVTITSKKTAVIDKTRGTAVWLDDVVAVRKSTGSTLMTEKLSIQRDIASSRLIWAEAAGNVKVVYYRILADNDKELSEINSNLQPVPHTVVTCDLATFSRKTALAELVGTVHVLSKDFELQAEKIRYNYHVERGKVTAKVGEQVRFVFYKKAVPDKQRPSIVKQVRQKITGLADEILLNRPSRKVILQGKVFIIDHSDQSQFRAERTELFFDEKEEIETAKASGNFSMNQPGRVSSSDLAIFEYDKEEVTLIGNAYVKEEQKVEVTSARIKMYIKVNKGVIRGVDDIPVKMEIEID